MGNLKGLDDVQQKMVLVIVEVDINYNHDLDPYSI